MLLQGLYDNFGASGGSLEALPPLPDAFARLPNLQVLNMSSSRLGAALPSSWTNLSQLHTLDISGTSAKNTTRNIPSSWCGLMSLRVFQAQGANLQGTLASLPVGGGCMPSLQVLLLGGNREIAGQLPAGKGQQRQSEAEGGST